MNLRTSGLWGAVAVVVLGLTACSGGDASEEQPSLATTEAALCSVEQTCPSGAPVTCTSQASTCNSGPDSGGWVECDGVRTYCPPACTCGSTRYTVTRAAEGVTCSAAANLARQSINAAAASRCPAGSCNPTETLGQCEPVGSGRLDGFRMSVTRTFSCNEPANCR